YTANSIATRGAFGNNGAATLATCIDGTSNTFAIGEAKQLHTSDAYGPYWGAGTHTSVHGYVPNASYTPNYRYGACPGSAAGNRWCQYAWGFGSYHPGITQFVMMDGSVQIIKDQISYAICAALCTPEGGEAAGQVP
ncbi:MAG TPA: DUF1559 domain-containing protein, partial [Pirellulaceae bacterium]|nr:DUF1559 domain-containing protein [Pirellulaceae bacterium]